MPNQLSQLSNKNERIIEPSRGSASTPSFESLENKNHNAKDNYLTKQLRDFSGRDSSFKQNIRVYERGAHIFYNGDESQALYFINSGSLKTYLSTEDGEEHVLGFHFPRDVVGFDGIDNEAHQASAVTLETTSVYRLAFANLTDSARGRGYPKLLSAQLSHDYQMLTMLAKKDACYRMARFLCNLARRFEANGYSSSQFNLSMSRHDIGNYLGMAVETVSRTLTRFQTDRLIDVDRRSIRIICPNKLREIAGAKI